MNLVDTAAERISMVKQIEEKLEQLYKNIESPLFDENTSEGKMDIEDIETLECWLKDLK